MSSNTIDLILLDIMMPDIDGFEVCKILKKNPQTQDIPILFITSNKKEKSMLNAFEFGGVDFIRKPLNAIEIQQRVKVHLNLNQQKQSFITNNILKLDDQFYWDKDISVLYKNNQIVKLTNSENLLLELFINKKNIVIEPIDICNYIYENFNKEYNNNSIRNLILNLKNKLPKDIISNIYGKGYIFNI